MLVHRPVIFFAQIGKQLFLPEASFFQLAPSAVGLDDDEMTQPFVIVPASVMCLVFWYCLTLDKIKASFKRDFDAKAGRQSSISIDVSKTDDNEEESCMGKGPCSGLSKGCRDKDSTVFYMLTKF